VRGGGVGWGGNCSTATPSFLLICAKIISVWGGGVGGGPRGGPRPPPPPPGGGGGGGRSRPPPQDKQPMQRSVTPNSRHMGNFSPPTRNILIDGPSRRYPKRCNAGGAGAGGRARDLRAAAAALLCQRGAAVPPIARADARGAGYRAGGGAPGVLATGRA